MLNEITISPRTSTDKMSNTPAINVPEPIGPCLFASLLSVTVAATRGNTMEPNVLSNTRASLHTEQNYRHTHFMNRDSTRLVAVATGGFVRVPEQEVNEIHPTTHLKQRTTLSIEFNMQMILSFSEVKLRVRLLVSKNTTQPSSCPTLCLGQRLLKLTHI